MVNFQITVREVMSSMGIVSFLYMILGVSFPFAFIVVNQKLFHRLLDDIQRPAK